MNVLGKGNIMQILEDHDSVRGSLSAFVLELEDSQFDNWDAFQRRFPSLVREGEEFKLGLAGNQFEIRGIVSFPVGLVILDQLVPISPFAEQLQLLH